MNKDPIKSAFMDDQDVLEVLRDKEGKQKKGIDRLEALNALFKGDDGVTPEKGKDYFTQEEIDAFKEEIKKGATPEKFVDYFTDAEIEYIVDHVREGIIDEVTPVKGVHYDDGAPGKNAEEVDITSLKREVIKDIRVLDEKQDAIDFAPEKLAEKLNTLTGAIDPKAIKGWVRIEDVVKAIKDGKLLDLRDIKGARLDTPSKPNMNDQRWHGGGDTVAAGTNIVITDGTGANTGKKVISAVSSGAFTLLTPTGAVDDSNVTFVFTVIPSLVVINGMTYRAGSKSGGVAVWTNVGTTVTLAFPVGSGGDIYGIA